MFAVFFALSAGLLQEFGGFSLSLGCALASRVPGCEIGVGDVYEPGRGELKAGTAGAVGF